jgi:sulfatase modifying factor 1
VSQLERFRAIGLRWFPFVLVILGGALVSVRQSHPVSAQGGQEDRGASAVGAARVEAINSGDPSAPLEPAKPKAAPALMCPSEMVLVNKAFCIDRFEASVRDAASGVRLSAYYPIEAELARIVREQWRGSQLDDPGLLRTPATGALAAPAVQFSAALIAEAVVEAGVYPQASVRGVDAEVACQNAGKRLCRVEEWRRACRGERDTQFPYGESYQEDACNIFRAEHPAQLLHGSAGSGHTDPRLNQAVASDGPLLRQTGESSQCASRWGSDAVYDMVGNLDEWIADAEGTFVGGFYSRDTRKGCDALISVHDYAYFDYSLGIRCCRDAQP